MKCHITRLLSIVKTIQNISNFYNSSERIASLIVKISNQIIKSCKRYITEGGRVGVWNQDSEIIEKKLSQCIKLNHQYREAYNHVRTKVDGNNVRKFSFSEQSIFGRFDAFCKRLKNLLDMFKKIEMFSEIFKNKLEALLPEESIVSEEKGFENAVRVLKMRDYDFLDFRNNQFDKDFMDFNTRLESIAEKMRQKLENCYDNIWDTPHAFQYLHRFKKLRDVVPVSDIRAKYERMIAACKADIERTYKYYNKNKDNPLLPREYPENPGKVYWVRALVYRISDYVEKFEKEEDIQKFHSYKQLVKMFNKIGVSMMQYEVKIENKLSGPKIRCLESMLALPIAKEIPEGRLAVNFHPILKSYLEENKKLIKLDIKIPSTNKFLIAKKDWLFDFKDRVDEMILIFDEASCEIHPDLKKLFTSHNVSLRSSFDCTTSEIVWTYKEWDSFCKARVEDIGKYRNLIKQANDIYTNRLEVILESILKIKLFEIPENEPWTIEFFLENAKIKCKYAAKIINTKSKIIEEAVEDIIELAMSDDSEDIKTSRKTRIRELDDEPFQTVADRQMNQNISFSGKELRKNTCKRVVDKLTQLIKLSLKSLTKHFDRNDTNEDKIIKVYKPKRFDYEDHNPDQGVIFVLEAYLNLPSIEVRPALEEVQHVLSTAGKIFISIAKGVGQWRQIKKREGNIPAFVPYSESKKEKKLYNPIRVEVPLIEEEPANFFKAVSETKEVTKSLYLLSNCLSSYSIDINNLNEIWSKYSFVWMDDKEEYINDLIASKPAFKKYEGLLHNYKLIKSQIKAEKETFYFGKFKIKVAPLIKFMLDEVDSWIYAIAKCMLQRYKSEMKHVGNLICEMDIKFDRPIVNLDDIRIIMEAQKKLREMEIDIEVNIETIQQAFILADSYNLQINKKDFETSQMLHAVFSELLTKGMDLQVLLLTVQEHFQVALLDSLAVFQEECDEFCKNYHETGPMQPGLSPKDASDKLSIFQNQFDSLWRKHGSYSVGEDLFGLDHTEQPGLNEIKKELNLLQRLYKLYNDVIDSVDKYHNILWKEINIEEINNELMEFGNRCRKLPKALKEWPAFHALKKTIDDFNDICPLLELMSNKAMKFRHWQKIQDLMDYKFEMERHGFALKDIMTAPIQKHKEDIEDICISALKERDIEAKLRQVTSEWTCQELEFQVFKNRGELLLRGDTTAETVGQAEDSLMILGSLLSNRFNAPFKKQIQKWITDLSNTSEILERWLLVQNLWVYLEAVFVGGDIAKQLPKEAKRFYKIDKTWQKIMSRAHDMPGVVHCCVGDDYLRQTLPFLQEQLEMCQKSLTGYLEKKRLIFPRFFFVSDPALLEILGQASDTHTIQAHLLSIFDNVATVTFHEQEYNKILAIGSSEGEVVKLEHPVRAEGSVEIWLNSLLKASQEAVHSIIRKAYHVVIDSYFDLLDFTGKFQAQIGILGLQILWTKESELALNNSRSDRKIMQDTNGKFLEILNTLIGQTTKHLDKIERRKYETLITVHMHQREIFDMMVRTNVKSTSDFDWLKQVRFYFKPDIEKTQIGITDVTFIYQNEYLGCQERLVITPLTDRCYITLAQAMGMVMGGAPNGPAGTGKTETVKDMAKTLGKYAVVFNCSDQMDYKGLGRIFKGLAQSGSWGCFDEFNRISAAVLSVAAQQISVVLSCKKEKQREFVFIDGDVVEMNVEFGIFITMNPTYAGRQELPENMKIQFRYVAMMVPDRQIIIRVKLASCGFLENITLARKFFTLYKLCEEQLSKQNHYDFGLRNILSVLKTLGVTKRECPKDSETTVVCRVLRDMNSSKLVDEDEPLFESLINDLFPNMDLAKVGHPNLEEAMDATLEEECLIAHPTWMIKLIQLYETQKVRHGIMVIGPSGAGKSKCITVLAKALSRVDDVPIKEIKLNPKSITDGQMFGKMDAATNDWSDGIFSSLWRKTMKLKKQVSWLILDGPVDPNWIENLNSVLDDNKILTLANGDRLPMLQNMKLIFEPQNVDNASPATVSRCGMVYMSSSGLDWKPLVANWIKKRKYQGRREQKLSQLFEKSFIDIYKFSTLNLKYVMKVLEVHVLHTLFTLLESLLPQDEGDEEMASQSETKKSSSSKKDDDAEENPIIDFQIEQVYIFSLFWAVGGYLENSDRILLQNYVAQYVQLSLPQLGEHDLFDYHFDTSVNEWIHWNKHMADYVAPEINPQTYGGLLIPNVSSLRMNFLIDIISSLGDNVLLVGVQGSAKTSLINNYLRKHNNEEHAVMNRNFSSTTTPQIFQKSIESNVDKRMGNIFGPQVGKKLSMFVDDINIPEINSWGDQPTNEFFRAVIEMKGFYSLGK